MAGSTMIIPGLQPDPPPPAPQPQAPVEPPAEPPAQELQAAPDPKPDSDLYRAPSSTPISPVKTKSPTPPPTAPPQDQKQEQEQDQTQQNQPQESQEQEPLYGGYTRFELELEFVSLLSSPLYLNHLASLKLLQDPAFVAYLAYLYDYWVRPEYVKFLAYPGPTLRSLELLQQEWFRAEVLSPEVVGRLGREWAESGVGGGEGG